MPRGILSLKNYEMHLVKGRGDIISVNREDYKNPFKIGQKVFADQKIWEITGIEGTMYLTFPMKPSSKIGLVVKEVKE